MLKSKDGLLTVEYVKSLADAPIHPADCSIVNIPETAGETDTFFNRLLNSPHDNHVSLVLCRHNKKNRLNSLAHVKSIGEYFNYLETVSISYQKPSSCSNNGLLPVAETGYLFFKGIQPDVKNTSWFQENLANATNMWDLGVREDEGSDKTYFKKFSWELQLLMFCLCGKQKYRTFIYAAPVASVDEIKHIHEFCKKYNASCILYLDDEYMLNRLRESWK